MSQVTSFAAGANHSIFLSSTNQIYACGAKGATGLPKDTDVPELLQPCVPAGAMKVHVDTCVGLLGSNEGPTRLRTGMI